jgi:hypothetical protein
MDLDYEAGIAFKRGDFDTAARIIAEARGLEPDRADLWDQRETQIKQAETQRTPLRELMTRRYSRSGILQDDPGLAQCHGWNRSLEMEMG